MNSPSAFPLKGRVKGMSTSEGRTQYSGVRCLGMRMASWQSRVEGSKLWALLLTGPMTLDWTMSLVCFLVYKMGQSFLPAPWGGQVNGSSFWNSFKV